jgi:hypothetical protein
VTIQLNCKMDSMPTMVAVEKVNGTNHNVTKLYPCAFAEFDDECVTASEMYACGREREPGLVDFMFNSKKVVTSVVRTVKVSPWGCL